MYQSTKRFGPITTTHRNWRAAHNQNRDSQKCAWIHGYSRYVEITFEGELDEQGWVQDFGNCKQIKQVLESHWDHAVLINSDDPELPLIQQMADANVIKLSVMDVSKDWGAGIEASCKWVYDHAQSILDEQTLGRVKVTRVQVWEHENNSAIYIPEVK
jgi:6-pyruvoyltetrahydropterin/6-carboxytetrahydropterin synthase